MTTASAVPATSDELEGDEALETLRTAGRRRLVADSVDRFRAADAFSHSRALAFQFTLTLLCRRSSRSSASPPRWTRLGTPPLAARPGVRGDRRRDPLRARADSFGATYGPIAGTIGVLLWTFLSAVALFAGLALAAQLEAVRAGVESPCVDREENA